MYKHFKTDIKDPNWIQSFNILLLSCLNVNLQFVWNLLLDLDNKIFSIIVKCAFKLELIKKSMCFFQKAIYKIQHNTFYKKSFLKNLDEIKIYLKKECISKIKQYTKNEKIKYTKNEKNEFDKTENFEEVAKFINSSSDKNDKKETEIINLPQIEDQIETTEEQIETTEELDNFTFFKNIFIIIKYFNIKIINPSVFDNEVQKIKNRKCLFFNFIIMLFICFINLIVMILKLLIFNICFFIIILLTVYFPIAFINLIIFFSFLMIVFINYLFIPLIGVIITFFISFFILLESMFFHSFNLFLIIFFFITYPIRLLLFYIINVIQYITIEGCYF